MDFIRCGICHRQLVDPRILPCLHTYCLRCIQANAAHHNGQFECPRKDKVRVPRNLTDILPVNRTLDDANKLLAHSSDHTQCSSCRSRPSDDWCSECAKAYCSSCSRDLHRLPAVRDHRQCSIAKKPIEWLSCIIHKDQQLKDWCQKCNVPVCRDCLRAEHKNHSHATILTVTNELQEKIYEEFANIESFLTYKVEGGGAVSDEAHESYQMNKKTVRDMIKFLRDVVQERGTEMLESIEAIETEQKAKLKDYNSRLCNELDSLDTQQQALHILGQSDDPMPLLRVRQDFLAYIARVNRVLRELREPMRREYTVEGIENRQDFREQIHRCWRVCENEQKTSADVVVVVVADGNPELKEYLAEHRTAAQWDIELDSMTHADMGILTSALRENSRLTDLHIIESEVDDQHVEQLTAVLKTNKTLRTLSLYDNKISDFGLYHLIEALQNHETLTTLDLGKNQITDRGIENLWPMLSRNRKLTTLYLSGNSISDDGAQDLADALCHNQTLLALHLSQNQIGPQGARHLAEALSTNKTLTLLNLYANNIDDKGARSIADALLVNKTLTTLYLAINRIGNDGLDDLVAALRKNQTLTTISLHHNQFDEQAQQRCTDALRPIRRLNVL